MTCGISVTLSDLGCLIGNGAAKFGHAYMAGYTAKQGRVRVPEQEAFYKEWKVG
jgi:hypothetical protein